MGVAVEAAMRQARESLEQLSPSGAQVATASKRVSFHAAEEEGGGLYRTVIRWVCPMCLNEVR